MAKIFAMITAIGSKMKKDYVSAFASQAALFVIMCIVPFILLMLTIIKYTPLTQDMLLDFVTSFSPESFKGSFTSIVNQVYSQGNTTVIIITAITVLWTAAKGFHALIDGLNAVYGVEETRNDFVIRLYSIFYTVVFAVILAICLFIFVMGNYLLTVFDQYVPIISNLIESILNIKFLVTIVLFTIFFAAFYVAIPSRHSKFRRQLPGALFAAIGWTGFTFFFSLYLDYSTGLTFLYGSLTNIICVMLWLYVCMYIFLMGAEINIFLEQWNIGKSVTKAVDVTHNQNTTANSISNDASANSNSANSNSTDIHS